MRGCGKAAIGRTAIRPIATGVRKRVDAERDPARATPDQVEQLEANVQELLEGGQGDQSGGGSQLHVPPGLLDQGGGSTNPLQDPCLSPDKC